MKLIIGIDPGKTTGFCAVRTDSSAISTNYTVYRACTIPFDNRLQVIYDFLMVNRDSVHAIVIESFKLFGNRRTMDAQINSEFPSVRVIGAVEAFAYLLSLQNRIVFQEPIVRKSVRIPEMHHAPIGMSDHIRDAYRHVRYYILANRGTPL